MRKKKIQNFKMNKEEYNWARKKKRLLAKKKKRKRNPPKVENGNQPRGLGGGSGKTPKGERRSRRVTLCLQKEKPGGVLDGGGEGL